MSYSELDPSTREIAERVLTEKQLEAFELECAEWSLQRIGRHLGIRKQTVSDRLEGAYLRLYRAGLRQDASGIWSKEEAA